MVSSSAWMKVICWMAVSGGGGDDAHDVRDLCCGGDGADDSVGN